MPSKAAFTVLWSPGLSPCLGHTTKIVTEPPVSEGTPVWVKVTSCPLGRSAPFWSTSTVLPAGVWPVTKKCASQLFSLLWTVHVTVTVPLSAHLAAGVRVADQAKAGAANSAATAVPTTAAPESFRSLRAVSVMGLIRDTRYDRLCTKGVQIHVGAPGR